MKRAINRDVSTQSPYPGIFAFELDFGGTLLCIPMSVRLKLDQTGIKLSLKQWNKLPAEERRQLVEKLCDELPQIEFYKQYLISLIEKFAKTSVELTTLDHSPPWTEPAVVPARPGPHTAQPAVISQALRVRVSPRPYPNAMAIQAGLGPEPTAIPLARPRLDIALASAGCGAADLAVCSCHGSSE
jgi:hypothetical protein